MARRPSLCDDSTGEIAQEIGRNNQTLAPTNVPALIKGFVSVRETQAQILQETLQNERFPVTRKEMQRLGKNVPSWLMSLCEEYVISSYTHALEAGSYNVAFSRISMDSPMNDNVKLCLSVMTPRQHRFTQTEANRSHRKGAREACWILGRQGSKY